MPQTVALDLSTVRLPCPAKMFVSSVTCESAVLTTPSHFTDTRTGVA